MSFIAERLGRIKPSPTVAISTKAAELKAGVVAALEAGQAEGAIDPGLAAAPAAEVLIALLDGLCGRSILDPEHDPHALLPTLRTLIRRFLTAPA